MGATGMKDDNSFEDLQGIADRLVPVTRFPLTSTGGSEKPRPAMCKWTDIAPDELKHELLRRNGRFQVMLTFLRLLPACAAVLDARGRLVFVNEPLAHYWKQRIWDLQGKELCQVMHLTADETIRNKEARERVLAQRFPEAYNEHFHNGGQLISMCCVPFPDDNDDVLLFALVLPHSGNGIEQRHGY